MQIDESLSVFFDLFSQIDLGGLDRCILLFVIHSGLLKCIVHDQNGRTCATLFDQSHVIR